MSADIIVEPKGAILQITLNRPGQGNAMSDEMVAELGRLIEGASATSQLVLLRGAGSDFCTGRPTVARPATPPEALERRRIGDVVFNFYNTLRNASVPVVGVVQGRAIGFGCALAAACDVTLASDAATFQVPEMAHNVLPLMVMSACIDRIPRKALSYLVYSTDTIDAERALSFGIVSNVFPAAKLDEAAQSLCERMVNTPRPAVRGVKEYLRVAPDMAVAGAVDFARNLHGTINSSSEMRRPH